MTGVCPYEMSELVDKFRHFYPIQIARASAIIASQRSGNIPFRSFLAAMRSARRRVLAARIRIRPP
jgi:hypothetical protein